MLTCSIIKSVTCRLDMIGFVKTLRNQPPECFLREALKFTKGDMLFVKEHAHLKLFVLNEEPTGQSISRYAHLSC